MTELVNIEGTELAVREWNIYSFKEYIKIKEEKPFTNMETGYLYIIEYKNDVKIGKTRRPYNRIKDLSKQCEFYSKGKTGRVAISCSHSNFDYNEKKLHEYFEKYRISNGELFKMKFEYAMEEIKNANLYFSNIVPQDSNENLYKMVNMLHGYTEVSQSEREYFFEKQSKYGFLESLAEFSKEKGIFYTLFSHIYHHVSQYFNLDYLWESYVSSEHILPDHKPIYLYQIFWFYPDVMEKIYDYLFGYQTEIMFKEFINFKSAEQIHFEEERKAWAKECLNRKKSKEETP